MKLSIGLAVLLLVSLALDAPSTATAARCVRRRYMCRRFGGVRGSCRVRICRNIGGRRRCRRVCRRRHNSRGRLVRRCRRVCRNTGRRRCSIRRYHRCRFNVNDDRFAAVDPFDTVGDADQGTPFTDPAVPAGQPLVFAPAFCTEQCYSARSEAEVGCNAELCLVQECPRVGGPEQYRCTSGQVPSLPSAADCFGGCARMSTFLTRRCNSEFCELRRCGSVAADTYSCVAKLVTAVPPTVPVQSTATAQVTATVPTTTAASCPSVCTTGDNGRNAFLTVVPTCRSTGCKVIFCKVADVADTFGYACVGSLTPGTAVTETPGADVTLQQTTTVATAAVVSTVAKIASTSTAAAAATTASTVTVATVAATTTVASITASTASTMTTKTATTATTTLAPSVVSAAE